MIYLCNTNPKLSSDMLKIPKKKKNVILTFDKMRNSIFGIILIKYHNTI